MNGSLSVNHPGVRKAVNRVFIRSAGGANRPRVYDSAQVYPAFRELESKFDVVQAEVDALLARRELPRYGDIDPIRAAEVSQDWRLYYAYMLGVPNERAKADCPTVLEFARSTPDVVNAMIAILKPGVRLEAHEGPYAGILRYHLALRVPKNNPPRIRIDQEYRTWKEGESFVIDDSFEHEVFNQSDSDRVLLIIDVRRPMGRAADALNRYCLRLKRKWSNHFIEQTNGDI